MTEVFAQAGAIPYRITDDCLEVLLISTSSGKHLTIPKGLIDPGFSATETIANEAYEEAGIEGDLVMPPMGRYRFRKWGGICEVSVYAMAVTRVMDQWPESSMRRRLWVEYRQAARQVKHPDLGHLILTLPITYQDRRTHLIGSVRRAACLRFLTELPKMIFIQITAEPLPRHVDVPRIKPFGYADGVQEALLDH